MTSSPRAEHIMSEWRQAYHTEPGRTVERFVAQWRAECGVHPTTRDVALALAAPYAAIQRALLRLRLMGGTP